MASVVGSLLDPYLAAVALALGPACLGAVLAGALVLLLPATTARLNWMTSDVLPVGVHMFDEGASGMGTANAQF